MSIEQANTEDLHEILGLQKLAFQSQAKIYDDYSITPLIETIEEVQKEFKKQTILKYMETNEIVGSVRYYIEDDKCHIGRLIVHPSHQNRGIGTILMREIEKRNETINQFELFTGHKSEKNLHIYHKLGYKTFKKEKATEDIILHHMKLIR